MRSAALVLFGLFTVSTSSAWAQETPQAGSPPRLVVRVEGTESAALQEKRDGDDDWRFVCELPCEATVTSSPHAQHRIVDEGTQKRVKLRGRDGERFHVSYIGGTNAARTPLFVLGGITGGAGVLLVGIGFLQAVRGIGLSEKDCGAACQEDRAAGRAGGTMMAVGFGGMLASGAMFLTGALVGRSNVTVTPAQAAAQGGRAPRVPEWTGPEPPKPPPLYARVTVLSF